MIGTKEICALLLAGGMGAGSVVAVQKAKPAISKPRPAASKPKVQKAVQTQTQTASITECPTVGPVGSADLSPMIAMETTEPLTGFRETATGPLGGGGIGDLAITYGYQRFDAFATLTTALVLIVIVQLIQTLGTRLARRLRRE